jgi:hypothetical protein
MICNFNFFFILSCVKNFTLVKNTFQVNYSYSCLKNSFSICVLLYDYVKYIFTVGKSPLITNPPVMDFHNVQKFF